MTPEQEKRLAECRAEIDWVDPEMCVPAKAAQSLLLIVDDLRAEVARLTADLDKCTEELFHYMDAFKEADCDLVAVKFEVARLTAERDEARALCAHSWETMRPVKPYTQWSDPNPGILPIGSHPTAEYRPEDSAAFGDDGGSVRKEKG